MGRAAAEGWLAVGKEGAITITRLREAGDSNISRSINHTDTSRYWHSARIVGGARAGVEGQSWGQHPRQPVPVNPSKHSSQGDTPSMATLPTLVA